MKKVSFALCLIIFGTMWQFIGCASQPQPKPLDLKTITGDIPVYSISIIVRKDLDTEEMGKKFFQKFYVEQIEGLISTLAAKGINCDFQKFLDEYNDSPNTEFEEMKIAPSFVLHRYFWDSHIRPETRLEIIINLIIQEDGSMPMSYIVYKDDPLYEPGYATSNTMKIKVSGS